MKKVERYRLNQWRPSLGYQTKSDSMADNHSVGFLQPGPSPTHVARRALQLMHNMIFRRKGKVTWMFPLSQTRS